MNIKTWPLQFGIVTLVIAIFPWSYWVYGLGKVIVCAVAAYYAYHNYNSGEKQSKVFWWFFITAIIFNPLLPVHLFFHAIWILVDVVVVALFWSYLKEMRHNDGRILEVVKHQNQTSSIEEKTYISKSMHTNKHTITSGIHTHLEYLGYKVEFMEDEKADVILATSETKSNIVTRIVDDLIVLSARYTTEINSDTLLGECCKVLDKVNSESIVSKWYTQARDNGKLTLVIEACQFGYEKLYFGKLIDRLELEIRTYMNKFLALEDRVTEVKE